MQIKVYVHARYNDWEKDWEFRPWSTDMSETDGFGKCVAEVEVEFKAPPREVLVNGQITAWRAEQKKIRAEAEKSCNDLERQIGDIQCIEYKPETV
jgi:hypothetical protein